MLRILVSIALTAGCLANLGWAQQVSNPPERTTATHFPPALEYWKREQDPIRKGLARANQLREKLLVQSEAGRKYLHRIESAIAQLTEHIEKYESHVISIDSFDVTQQRLGLQLSGQERLPVEAAFDAFNGRWYGTWDHLTVNHDWKPSQRFTPAKTYAPDQPRVSALQYAWIGNGFGWNYLAELDRTPGSHCVLGQVYYLDSPAYRRISGEQPHVGFIDNPQASLPNRIVWITEANLFLEEAFLNPVSEKDFYVITGITHNLFAEPPTIATEAVQARYSRAPELRPKFRRFRWQPELSRLDQQ